jgi:carbonic anhydrase/acetyltransferase-like protein (isoleucine patch superfamily)
MSLRSFSGISPDIGDAVFVDETALVIGDVKLGKDCSVWPMTVIRGDVNKIRLGSGTNIQDGSILHVTHPHESIPDGYALTVGNNVTVGHNVVLHGCSVADNCLIGMSSTIMDGAIVHPYVIIGAGSIVTPGKNLEGGYLWLGSPVRKVRELTAAERKWIAYSANHYIELKNKHMDIGKM